MPFACQRGAACFRIDARGDDRGVFLPRHLSETRTEKLVVDLLDVQGWNTAKPPKGNLLRHNEYRCHPRLKQLFTGRSKQGTGDGYPDFLLVDSACASVQVVIEAKANLDDFDAALAQACFYAEACLVTAAPAMAVGVAGQEETGIRVGVRKWVQGRWQAVLYQGGEVSWIPTPADARRLLAARSLRDLTPQVPRTEVLFAKADKLNRLLRESKVRDEHRPGHVGAMILALWRSGGRIRRHPEYVLRDINAACADAFRDGGKSEVAASLRIDQANDGLARRAWEILAELEKLNVVGAALDHDYLGQLYELFFRYTGANTIGQYFTPRHITRFLADVCQVTATDLVIDPACGTGGFLIAVLQRLQQTAQGSYQDTVRMIRDNLIGFEVEPVTAALCVANMILRGDGKSGIRKDDCFTAPGYPIGQCDVALLNPPFPHKSTDTPTQDFIDRALAALKPRGRLGVIVPSSFLVKRQFQPWRDRTLRHNSLVAVCQLPDELFQPYASATTCVMFLERGVPHDPARKTVFVRVERDGYTLKRKVRVPQREGVSQLPSAVEAILNKQQREGFSGVARVAPGQDWAPGAAVPSARPSDGQIRESVDELLRRATAFYVRHAPQVARLRAAVARGSLKVTPYRAFLSVSRRKNAAALAAAPGTIGGAFLICYGMKELHSREDLPAGDSLIISPTENDNGCYGWLRFPTLVQPPFVTVAQTGSIGEAFVQREPCAVNDDCLILLPREDTSLAHLFIAASIIRLQRWRFNYGRKLTPARIADFPLHRGLRLEKWIDDRINTWKTIGEQAVHCGGCAPLFATPGDLSNRFESTETVGSKPPQEG